MIQSQKPRQEGKTIWLDDHGDLTLKVGAEHEQIEQAPDLNPHSDPLARDAIQSTEPPLETIIDTFVVCSRTLARSSPVFKAMLFGTFKEARPSQGAQDTKDDAWTVELPDDDCKLMLTMLRMVHSYKASFSSTVKFGEIYDIVSICKKYSCIGLLAPFRKSWIKRLSQLLWGSFIIGDVPGATLGSLMAVSWALCSASLVSQCAISLLRYSVVDEDGKIRDNKGRLITFDGHLQSPALDTLLKDIQSQRVRIIDQIIASVNSALSIQDNDDDVATHWTCAHRNRVSCFYSQVGILANSLPLVGFTVQFSQESAPRVIMTPELHSIALFDLSHKLRCQATRIGNSGVHIRCNYLGILSSSLERDLSDSIDKFKVGTFSHLKTRAQELELRDDD